MYKFEISADSPQELREKMLEFANDLKTTPSAVVPEYGNEPDDDDQQQELFKGPVVQTTPLVANPFLGAPAPESVPQNVTPIDFSKFQQSQVTASIPQNVAPIPEVTPAHDARGLPWDERIHASTKSLAADGTWRTRRGVSKEMLYGVEQELIAKIKSGAVFAHPAPVQQAPAPAPFVAPPPPAVTVPVEVPVFGQNNKATPWENSVPAAAATPVQQPTQPSYENVTLPPGTKPAHSLVTFKNNLMQVFAQLINEKKIDANYIESLKKYFGVKEIWNVLSNEAQCIELYNTFCQTGLITRVD